MIKARNLFDNTIVQGIPVSRAELVMVLVDYSRKMESILKDMRVLFAGLELEVVVKPQSTSLDHVPNFSMDIEDIPSLDAWGSDVQLPLETMPTKPNLSEASSSGKDLILGVYTRS